VFLDECGVLTNMACLHGRAPRGQRARGTAPAGRWERVTVLGALGADGIVAAMSVEAATDAAVFLAYLDQVLLPKLRQVRPDAVLLMDNLAAHKTPAVRALLDASGFGYRYLPAYSPDLNPNPRSPEHPRPPACPVPPEPQPDAAWRRSPPACDACAPSQSLPCCHRSLILGGTLLGRQVSVGVICARMGAMSC